VLFALHAYSTEPGVIDDSMDMVNVAVKERGFIFVTARGLKNSHGKYFWNATRPCCDAERQNPDDLGYLRAVFADVARRYAVDTARVYAVGVSNGAFMAHRWACEPGGDLTGIIAMSGVGPGTPDPPCRPSRPVEVLQIHGDADETVHYGGGEMNGSTTPAVATTVSMWAALDGCAQGHAPERAKFEKFGLDIESETYVCPKATVMSWRVVGGAHNLKLRRGPFKHALELVDRGALP
jgi:polyhydroxybutyrate depolymerase